MSYKVSFNSPYRTLGKSDLIFIVKKDTAKTGTLRVSKGGIVWVAKNKKYGKKLNWEKFGELMRTVRKKERKRKIQTKARKIKGR